VKVLIVSQYFWPEPFRINDVALGLRDAGHDVTVLTGLPNYPEGRLYPGYRFSRLREDFEGIPVVRVPLVPRGRGGGLRLALNYASFAAAATLMGPLRLPGRFDAILVFEPSPVTVALPGIAFRRLRAAPLLFWVQDLWPESVTAAGAVRARWIIGLIERLVRFIYRRCDRILVQSLAFRPAIERLGTPARKIAYLPNSAETLYRPTVLEPDAPERALVPQGFRVMFAGNIGVAQSFETILEAASRLREHPEIQWVILGEGRLGEWARAEAARRGLQQRIRFLGRHPVESMPRFFALADVLLVTLKRDPIFSLTIPSKVQSYLACGRPVVAALDGEGARVLTEARAGIACPAEDAAALAAAVLELYRMPQAEREAMGARGRAYFESEFDRDMLLRRLIGLMQTTASEAKRCES
jgi:glycosyltransferase involved in cell wall biosynthesis